MLLFHAVVDGPGTGSDLPVLVFPHLVGQQKGSQGEVLGGAEVFFQGIVEAQPLVQFLLGGRFQGQEGDHCLLGDPPEVGKEARAGPEQVPAVVEAVHLCRLVFLGEDAGTHGVKVGILPREGLSQGVPVGKEALTAAAQSLVHHTFSFGKGVLPPSWFSPIVYPKTLALSMPFLGGRPAPPPLSWP